MDVVSLQNGPDLPMEAFALALALETRGFLLSVDGETLRLRPATDGSDPLTLTETERADIRRWKGHLMAIVDYCQVREGADRVRGAPRKRNPRATRATIK